MLDNCTIEERWNAVDKLVERWLQERQLVIVQFCALSGVHELNQDDDPSSMRLQNFCQLLVDYMSAGHFEVYYEVIREAEAFQDGSVNLAKGLMPEITLRYPWTSTIFTPAEKGIGDTCPAVYRNWEKI